MCLMKIVFISDRVSHCLFADHLSAESWEDNELNTKFTSWTFEYSKFGFAALSSDHTFST